MKRLLCAIVLLAAACVACQKPIEKSLDVLASDKDKDRQAAIVRLGKEGAPLLPKLAPMLNSDNLRERKAVYEIVRRLGKAAMPTMFEQIGAVWKDKDARDGFVEYFRSLGDDGYRTLLDELYNVGVEDGKTSTSGEPGAMARSVELNGKFESTSFILENLTNRTEVGRLPELLRNPSAPVRVRIAYLLCLKGWKPVERLDAAIYYTHLIATLNCPQVPEPASEAGRLAAADLPFVLATLGQYPPGGDAFEKTLANAGSDSAARYAYDQAVKADNEFTLLNYYRILLSMDTQTAQGLAKKLLADPRAGGSIRALDPDEGK